MGGSLSSNFIEATASVDELRKLINEHKGKHIEEKQRLEKHPDNELLPTRNALHVSCETGRAESAKLLVQEAKFDPNMKNGDRETPLHLAARSGSLEIVKMLLENGADSCMVSASGRTPLMCAVEGCFLPKDDESMLKNDKTKIAYMLKHRNLSRIDSIIEIIQEILSTSTKNINHCDLDGETALHKAVSDRMLDPFAVKIVPELLASGADPNIIANDKIQWYRSIKQHSTVLNRAVHKGNPEIVSLLLAGGAQKNRIDPASEVTPLFLSLMFNFPTSSSGDAVFNVGLDATLLTTSNVHFHSPMVRSSPSDDQDDKSSTKKQKVYDEPTSQDALNRIAVTRVLAQNGCIPAVPPKFALALRSLMQYALSKFHPECAREILECFRYHVSQKDKQEEEEHQRNKNHNAALAFPAKSVRLDLPRHILLAVGGEVNVVEKFRPDNQEEEKEGTLIRTASSVIIESRVLHSSIENIKFSPDSSYVCVSSNETLVVFHAKTGVKIANRHFIRNPSEAGPPKVIHAFCFSKSSGHQLFTVTRGGEFTVFLLPENADDALTKTPLWEHAYGGPKRFDVNWNSPVVKRTTFSSVVVGLSNSTTVVGMDLFSDDRIVVAFHDKKFGIVIFDATAPSQHPKVVAVLALPENPMAIKCSPDGQTVWVTLTSRQLLRVTVNPDGSCKIDNSLAVLVRNRHNDYINVVDCPPTSGTSNSPLVLTASQYENVTYLWNHQTKKLFSKFTHERKFGSPFSPHCGAFCPADENLFALCGCYGKTNTSALLLIQIDRSTEGQEDDVEKFGKPDFETLYESRTKIIAEYNMIPDRSLNSGANSGVAVDSARPAQTFSRLTWASDGKSLAVLHNSGIVHYFEYLDDAFEFYRLKKQEGNRNEVAQVVDLLSCCDDGDVEGNQTKIEVVYNTGYSKTVDAVGLENLYRGGQLDEEKDTSFK